MRRIFGILTLLVSVIGPASLEAQQLTLVIDATSPASPYSTDVGRRRVFICRPNLPIQPIWGTDVYTDDSPICSAAVHAGAITQAQGGVVTILIGEARESFTGSKRNGVESTSWTSQRRSYKFDSAVTGQLDWATSAGALPSEFSTPFDATCPQANATTVAGVTGIFGTDVYTADSPICVAALHAGVITLDGGKVHFVSRGAQTTFTASTRNSVTSRSYGAWDNSFSVSSAVASVSTPTSGGVTAGPLPQGSVTSPSIVTATQPTASSPVTAVTTTTTTATATAISRTVTGLKAVYTSGTTASVTWDKVTWMTPDQEFFVVDAWAEKGGFCPMDAQLVDPKTCKRKTLADVTSVTFDVTALDPSQNYYFRVIATRLSGSSYSYVWTPIATQEVYTMRSAVLASPTLNGPINTTVISGGPAPVLGPITGTVAAARLTWDMPDGSPMRFEVWRKAGSGSAEFRSSTDYYSMTYQDSLADPRLTYQYQVKAVQRDGTYGVSSWVSYTPPKLMNPGSFGGRLSGDGEATLFWQPVTGVDSFRVDGPGLPATGALAAAGDTSAVRVLADSVERYGSRSAYGRDQKSHHYLRGLLFVAHGRDEDAVREFRAAIHSPNFGFTRVNYELARALLRLGRPAEAVATLQSSLRGEIDASNLYITRTDLHELLAQAFQAAMQADSAAVHYRAVVNAWRRADPIYHARRARAADWLARFASASAGGKSESVANR